MLLVVLGVVCGWTLLVVVGCCWRVVAVGCWLVAVGWWWSVLVVVVCCWWLPVVVGSRWFLFVVVWCCVLLWLFVGWLLVGKCCVLCDGCRLAVVLVVVGCCWLSIVVWCHCSRLLLGVVGCWRLTLGCWLLSVVGLWVLLLVECCR